LIEHFAPIRPSRLVVVLFNLAGVCLALVDHVSFKLYSASLAIGKIALPLEALNSFFGGWMVWIEAERSAN